MNNWIGMGRLTAEPDLKYSNQNPEMAITRYTLAVDKGRGDKKKAIFVNCVAFGKAGEFVSKYFHKGQRVLVSGELDIQDYEKNGEKKKYTQVITNTHEFADAPKQNKTESNDAMAGFENVDDSDDDLIPF